MMPFPSAWRCDGGRRGGGSVLLLWAVSASMMAVGSLSLSPASTGFISSSMSLLPASRLGSATALFPCHLIAKTSQQEARPRILSLAMQGREDRVPWVDLRAGDGRGQRRGGPARGRGGGRGDSFEPRAPRNDRMVPWSRGDDGIKEMDEEAIEEQLQRRERAKRNRDFEVSPLRSACVLVFLIQCAPAELMPDVIGPKMLAPM
eukprot:2023823-Rhodomonas_salina.4